MIDTELLFCIVPICQVRPMAVQVLYRPNGVVTLMPWCEDHMEIGRNACDKVMGRLDEHGVIRRELI